MVDTVRTRPEILALLPDNTSGDISPQDIRDAIVSMFGVWAAIYLPDGSTAQTGITNTPEKITGFTNNVTGVGGMTPDYTDNSIEVPADGDYFVFAQIAYSGDNNQSYEIHVTIDGAETPFGTHRHLDPGDEDSVAIFAPLEAMSAGEKIALYINVPPAETADFTPIDMQLAVLKVS